MTNFYNFYRLFCLYGFKILAMFNNVLIMGAHGEGGRGRGVTGDITPSSTGFKKVNHKNAL
jgi:hypothetical protein